MKLEEWISDKLSPKEPFSFEEVSQALVNHYNKTRRGNFNYESNENIHALNLCATNPEINVALSEEEMKWRKDEHHRSFLSQIISNAMLLGMEQQARIINKEVEKFTKLKINQSESND